MENLKLFNKKMIKVKHKKLDLEYTFSWSIEKDKYIVIRNKYINGYYAPGGWKQFTFDNLHKLEQLVFNAFDNTYLIKAY